MERWLLVQDRDIVAWVRRYEGVPRFKAGLFGAYIYDPHLIFNRSHGGILGIVSWLDEVEL